MNKVDVLKKQKVLFIMFAPYRTVQIQIAALSAFLKRYGYEVKYLEILIFSGETFEEYKNIVKEQIQEFQPDLIGFSSYDMNYSFILDCGNYIKNLYPNIKIIVGGHHASLAPEDYMQIKSIDYVCVGEGEYVLRDLLEVLSNGGRTETISGLCFRDSEKNIIYNSARNLVEDLDKLPFLDRTIVHSQQLEIDYLPMFAGKGCPFSCTYCANESIKNLYSNKNCYVRYRSPEKIIEEIAQCKKIYRFNHIYFYDDVFSLNYIWLQNFCDYYVKHFPDLPFQCLLRPEIASNEKYLRLLSKSGCQRIVMGVESGSQDYRKKMLGRAMTNKTILKGARLVKKHKMKLSIFMMVGLPGETFLDMIKSLWVNFRVGAHEIQTGIFYPIKNTPLYRYCLEHNLINDAQRKKIVVYTYDTCLNFGTIKRRLVIILKWLNSATPFIRHFRFSLVPHFFRIQYRKWFKKVVDYK